MPASSLAASSASSKELVPADLERQNAGPLQNAALLSGIVRAQEQVPELVEGRDGVALEEMEAKMRATAYAATQAKQAEMSLAAARACIAAVAGRGQLIGEGRIAGTGDRRKDRAFRALGAARARGHLPTVLEQTNSVNITDAAQRATRSGLTTISRKRVGALIKKRASERGVSVERLGRDALHSKALSSLVDDPRSPQCMWWPTWRAVEPLGIDIRGLPPAKPRKQGVGRGHYRRPKWRSHKIAPGDGDWAKMANLLTALRDEADRLCGGLGEQPLLWEHIHGLSNIIGRENRAGK
jgi:hypothetical protein